MDILGCEFHLTFTSPLWIVHWKSKALQNRPSNQYTSITVSYCYRIMLQKVLHMNRLFGDNIQKLKIA